jgi:hypothetical protein
MAVNCGRASAAAADGQSLNDAPSHLISSHLIPSHPHPGRRGVPVLQDGSPGQRRPRRPVQRAGMPNSQYIILNSSQ